MNYVERLFSLRRGVTTRRLYINWCLESSLNVNGGDEEEYRILSGLRNAVVCEVKELELVLKPKSGSAFSLPPSLIHSMSLEYYLNVESLVTGFTDGIVKFPSYSSIGYSSLKCLRLSHVRIDESFGNWVSTCCRFLENLSLSWIKEIKSLIIDSSCLQGLHISSRDLCHLQVSAEILRRFTLFWQCDSPNNRTFQLSTPKLLIFTWSGNILSFPLTESLAYLKSVGSILGPSSASTLTSQSLARLYADDCDVKYFDRYKLLLRVLSDGGRIPVLFPSLLALHVLTASINSYLVQLVASLVERCGTPYRYLYIWNKVLPSYTEKTEREDCESTKYCDAKNGMTFMHNLKVVTVELISQGKNELEMIKYLLKNAKYLQMMTILYVPPLGSDVIVEIRGHEKASVDVLIKFHPI